MPEHARSGAGRRSFPLPDQAQPVTSTKAASPPAPGPQVRLTEETTTQLQTLLRLCRTLADASSGEIAAELAGRWITLVRSGQPPSSVQGRTTDAPYGSDIPPFDGRQVFRVPGIPALVLSLATSGSVPASTGRLLSAALSLAMPILRDGEACQREEEARQRVLNVQAELAHNLRTPLTAISGFAQLLQRPGQLDEARRRSYAGIAVTESQQATAIIDHLVDKLQAEADALGAGAKSGSGGGEGHSLQRSI